MAIYENFILILVLSVAHLESVYSVEFEFCNQREINDGKGRFIFNISNAKNEGEIECRRLFVMEQRIKLTINTTETFFRGKNDFEVYDGGFNARKITPVGPKGEGTYETTGNTMAVVLKAEKKADSSANVALFGTLTPLPFQATCKCKGIKNGIQRCWDDFGVRKCEITCKKGYIDLASSTGNFSCNLSNGKWSNGLEPQALACQSTITPSVALKMNFSFTNALLCNESSKEKISSFFKDYFKARKSISENGQCFGQKTGSDCLMINCVEKNYSSFVSVTIDDQAITKSQSVEEKVSVDLFAAYNSTSFQEIEGQLFAFMNDTLGNSSKLHTVGNSVKRQCPHGLFLFMNEGDIEHSVCSKCPAGTFYDSFKCEKCPSGTFSLEGSASCSKKVKPSTTSFKDSCEIYCPLGKGIDLTTGFCQWCSNETYQYRTDVPNINCSPCPKGKRTPYPEATGINKCYVPCAEGTFFSLEDENCLPCLSGTYQVSRSHLHLRCLNCGQGKVTYSNGSTNPSQCVPSCEKGHYLESKTSQCVKCPFGSYQAKINQLNCTQCPDGMSTLKNGSSQPDCVKTCQMGRYFDLQSSSCMECLEGTYMDQNGHLITSCIKCPGNKTTQNKSAINETQCLDRCDVGEYLNTKDASCNKCPRGTYMDHKGHFQNSCFKCSENQTTQDEGSDDKTSCLHECGPGEFFVSKNRSCSKCPLGTYMDQSGHFQTSCIPCADDKTTHVEGAGHEKHCIHRCIQGEYFVPQSGSCSKCPLGSYMNETIHLNDHCIKCPPGTTTRSSGETTKLACGNFICGPGEYIDNTKKCQLCPIGTYQSAVNHTLSSCQQCPSNNSKIQGAKNRDSCVKICDSFPCENGAKCVENADDYCACPTGVMGKYCEVIEKQEELIKLEMSLRFTSLNWSEELRDAMSAKYRRIKYLIESSLREELKDDESFVGAQVNKMVRGSVIANFDLYLNDNASEVPAKDLQIAVISRGSIGRLSVDPGSLSIKTVTCDRALGMENSRIKDGQITASSESEGQEANRARLNSAKGWLAKEVTSSNYIQIGFTKDVNITSIATQGDSVSSYVTTYSLSYSKDGDMWVRLQKNFTGNNDTNSVIKNTLQEPITLVKYIRVIPATWSNGIGMRIELYGCISDPVLPPEEIPTTVPTTVPTKEADVKAVASKDNEYSWGKYLGITFGLLMIVGCLIAFFMWWRSSKKKQQREETPLVMTKEGEYKALDKNDTLEYDEHRV